MDKSKTIISEGKIYLGGQKIQKYKKILLVLKLEYHTEISTYMFHSQKPADLNFPPKHMKQQQMSQLCLKHIR